MITAYEICSEVYGLSGFGIPSAFHDGGDPDDRLIFFLLKRVGRDISKYRWQELLRTHRLPITLGKHKYDLPSDFREFVPNSMRAENDLRPVDFPAPIETWAHIDSRVGATGILHRLRMQAGKLITPDQDEDEYTLRFEYLSNFPAYRPAENENPEEYLPTFGKDSDQWLLDEDLVIKGLKVKWSLEKGLDTLQADSADYASYLNELKATDSSSRRISLGGGTVYYPSPPYTNLWRS